MKTAMEMSALCLFAQSNQASVLEIFHTLDVDGDGSISIDEWVSGMTAVATNATPPLNVSERTIAFAFEQVDADGSGELDYQEFGLLFKPSSMYAPMGQAELAGEMQRARARSYSSGLGGVGGAVKEQKYVLLGAP